jgi:hypothetical protein
MSELKQRMPELKQRMPELKQRMPELKTEDTGKIFEMAICKTFDIPFVGKYKYEMEEADSLMNKLILLKNYFPPCVHTAKGGNQYDFSSIDGLHHLSAKTIKRGTGKVAPQRIGQSSPKKFCSLIGIEFTTIENLKEYIQLNITCILPFLMRYTFDCMNLYYHKERDEILLIQLIQEIDWSKYEFIWTCSYEKWNNSSSLKIKINERIIPLVEFQIHSKSRTNMAIRWFYDNFLMIFKKHLNIIKIF